MSTINILHRWTGAVLLTAEAATVREAMEAACRSGANLIGANLIGANLIGANLSGADLIGADLIGADLSGANLSGANLIGADLSGANLSGANLIGADLSGADLSGANLSGAYLSGADLSGANLSGANLIGAIGIDLIIARTRILPEGRLIGWKKCADGVIVKLVIPEDSKRSHAFGRKCRAEFAEVLEIIGSNEARSHTSDFPAVIYRVGKTVRPANGWSEDWREECAPGIHFFITRAEAEAY